MKFLLEALTAIKNNNVHKLLDVTQQQQLIRLQKLLKTYTRGLTHSCLYIGVGDGGAGGHVPPTVQEKYFFGNYYIKFGHFSGKNHVKFGYFADL